MGQKAEVIYKNFQRWRDKEMQGICKIFTKLHLSANGLSIGGVFLMIGFAIILPYNLLISLIFLLFSKLADLFDGPLARYQKKNTQNGAWVDNLADQTSFTIFLIGCFSTSILDPFLGMTMIILVPLSKYLRGLFYKTNKHLNSKYKDIMLPITIASIPYWIPVIILIFGLNLFQQIIPILNIILAIDCLIYSLKLLFEKSFKTNN